jgi:hypothetical protein
METTTHRHDRREHTAHNTPKHASANAKSTAHNTKRSGANTEAPFTMKDPRKDTDNRLADDEVSAGEAADNRKEADFGRPTDSYETRVLNLRAERRPVPRRRGDRTGRRRVRR